jgi:hypothetical protein
MVKRQIANRKRMLKSDRERTESLAFEFARQDLLSGLGTQASSVLQPPQ